MASTINASTSGAGGVITTADASGVLNIQTAGTTAIAADTSQNVAIGGITPSAWNTARKAIEIGLQGNAIITNTSNGTMQTIANIYVDSTGASKYVRDGFGVLTASVVGSGSFQTYVYPSGTAGTTATPTQTFQIDSNGYTYINSGYGSIAVTYGCRAWVRFTGVTTVTVSGSGNVSSVTRNATGDYTVAFTTAMPDANFAAVISGSDDITNGWTASRCYVENRAQTTSSVRINGVSAGGTAVDLACCNVAILR
jgi:hypothetical protein